MRLPATLLLLGLLLLPATSADARRRPAPEPEPTQEEEDPLALTALLIRDGHWDRAAIVLEKVDPSDEELDLQRYHALSGLVAFHQERFEGAVRHLMDARAAGLQEPRLGIYIALGLVELGLYQAALDEGRSLLEGQGPDAGPELWLVLGEAMRRAGQPGEAARLLEGARLRFPETSDIAVQLASSLLANGRPLSAGLLLERESLRDAELSLAGAECLRRAGRLQRALLLNARVPEPSDRYKQRLGLLIELEDYERAAALAPRLSRAGLLLEDEIAYAVAYARFRGGDLEGSGELLGRIADPSVHRKALRLREALAACEEEPESCT